MTDNRRVEIVDDEIEQVVGGVAIRGGYVTNKDTGERFKLQKSDIDAFMFVSSFGGSLTEGERIQKLRENGYI